MYLLSGSISLSLFHPEILIRNGPDRKGPNGSKRIVRFCTSGRGSVWTLSRPVPINLLRIFFLSYKSLRETPLIKGTMKNIKKTKKTENKNKQTNILTVVLFTNCGINRLAWAEYFAFIDKIANSSIFPSWHGVTAIVLPHHTDAHESFVI